MCFVAAAIKAGTACAAVARRTVRDACMRTGNSREPSFSIAAGSVCAFAAGAGLPGAPGAASEGGAPGAAGAGFPPAGVAGVAGFVVLGAGVAGFGVAGFCADAGVDGVAGWAAGGGASGGPATRWAAWTAVRVREAVTTAAHAARREVAIILIVCPNSRSYSAPEGTLSGRSTNLSLRLVESDLSDLSDLSSFSASWRYDSVSRGNSTG